jgi:hypothetical protein
MQWKVQTDRRTHGQMKPRAEALKNYFGTEEWRRVKT